MIPGAAYSLSWVPEMGGGSVRVCVCVCSCVRGLELWLQDMFHVGEEAEMKDQLSPS